MIAIVDDNRNCFRTVTVLVVEYLALFFFDLIFFFCYSYNHRTGLCWSLCVLQRSVSVVSGAWGVLGPFFLSY